MTLNQTTATAKQPILGRGGVLRAKFASFVQRQGALVALVLVCVFAAIRYPNFSSPENIANVLRQNSMLGLVALGMTFVILSGGIDLSVGALLAVAGVVAANLAGRSTVVAVLVAVGLTTLLGAINGLIIAKVNIQPFIVTLAMMIAARGLALASTGEQSVRVSRLSTVFTQIGRGWLGPIPVPVLILVVALMICWATLAHTRFGRHVYSIGDNREAARLMGLNIGRITVAIYALSGTLSGLAGVVLASRLGAGQPVAGAGWELDAIAATVVGGTLLKGGQGGVGGTIVGVLLLGIIYNLFNLEGTISPWWQQVFRGLILLAVVILQNRLAEGDS